MTKPTTRFYISFDTGWTGSSPTWTEVTNRVRTDPGTNITTWRSEELSEAQPNQCSLVLRNDDGRFTPGNTSSIYYPNVRRGRRLKVVSTLGGVDYVRFLGYIDDWRPQWTAGVSRVNDCTISATSRMARLGRGVELRSVVEEEILVDNPVAYYTLGEPEGSTAAGDTSGIGQPALTQTGSGAGVDFGSGTGPGVDGLTAAQFAGGKYLTGVIGSPGSGASLVAECWVARSGAPVGLSETILTIFTDQAGTVPAIIMQITNAGTISCSAPSGFGSVTSVATVTDGGQHHIALCFTSAGALLLYIDGVLDNSTAPAGALLFPIGHIDVGGGRAFSLTLTATLSHVAIYNDSQGATSFAGPAARHYQAGRNGFAGESSGTRIARYASYLGLDPATLSLETGKVAGLAHIDTTGKTAVDAMRTVVTTEGGVLFDGRDGTLTLHDRAHRYATPSAFTLDVPSGHVAQAPEPVLDDQQQVNDITAAGAAITVRVTNATSVNDHGWYRSSLDLATTDAGEPGNHANWLVGRYAEPILRISAVEVLLNKLPDALAAAVLAATVGTRFKITGVPTNGTGTTTLEVFVEGVAETIDGSTHRLTLHTSPAAVSDVFTLDDATRGTLDGGYTLGW